jgi:hypothetical protein
MEGSDCDIIWGTILTYAWKEKNNHEKPHSAYPVFKLRFEPGTIQYGAEMNFVISEYLILIKSTLLQQ